MNQHPMDPTEIRTSLAALRSADLPSHGGSTLAYVYDSGLATADELGREALAGYAASNALDPTAFPSLLQMENDLVGLAADLLAGPPGCVGSVTSGGTESLLLSVVTARDGCRDVTVPEMVLPSSAHASFQKAAHYFGVTPVFVDVDPTTGRADPAAMAAAITERTVLVVASAPSYAHGVVDPVGEIAAAAAERGVRCHVDACIGGWLLPFLDRTPDGRLVPDFSFAVPGVSSISVDLHKYAYTPKGASILLHRDAELRRPQFFASARWPGYTMLNSTTQSTRSGGPLAAAWAVTHNIGIDGYLRLAERVRDGMAALLAGVERIDHVHPLVAPDSSLLALGTDHTCDVFTVADEMAERGWFVQPQMGFGPFPASVHLSLSAATTDRIDEALTALAGSVAAARDHGPVAIAPELAAAAGALDPATLDDAAFTGLLQLAGLAGDSGAVALPRRMAPVNALLDVAPPALREALMINFLDRLARPNRSTD
ncbi:MAG: pyridoxal phosphate-dependent decarboxylase family protein [Propionibacteriaceae bacterium]